DDEAWRPLHRGDASQDYVQSFAEVHSGADQEVFTVGKSESCECLGEIIWFRTCAKDVGWCVRCNHYLARRIEKPPYCILDRLRDGEDDRRPPYRAFQEPRRKCG